MEGVGFYISAEIGPVSGWDHECVAMQGSTVEERAFLVYVPTRYVEQPEMLAGIVMGEIDEEEEGVQV